ncbi:MAG: ATP-binding protein [Spirochaetales bacterium]|nr:ATP-binding protein [Spirochaetales bacterium]
MEQDIGKQLENQVFRDILTHNIQIFFYKNKNTEVDFIDKDTAIQVCYRLTEKNSLREIQGLEECAHKKEIVKYMLLICEEEYRFEHKNIQIIPYWKTAKVTTL